MDAFGGVIFNGFLSPGMSMHVDGRNRQARNQLMAVADLHGRLHARAGLCRFADRVSRRAFVGL